MSALAEPLDVTALAERLRHPLLKISRRLRQESQKAGVSVQDAILLGLIRKLPGIGVSELADAEQTSRPTMSGHVKRLEAAGWIRRTEDETDARRSGLVVTPAGERQVEAIKRRRNDWLARRLAKLSEAEREALSAAAGPLMKLLELEP